MVIWEMSNDLSNVKYNVCVLVVGQSLLEIVASSVVNQQVPVTTYQIVVRVLGGELCFIW